MTFIDGAKLRPQPRQSDAPTTPPRAKVDPARKAVSAPTPQAGQQRLRQEYRRKSKFIAVQYQLPIREGTR